MRLSALRATEILASGGYPTIQVTAVLDDGSVGVASVPYGASAGTHEATVLIDGDEGRYHGKGMLKAVDNVELLIWPALQDVDPNDQRQVDQIMLDLDGTPNKAKLGGNAILAVSLAVAKAAAASKSLPFYRYIAESYQTGVDFSQLPQPMAVMIEGGKHADDTTDFQEYSIGTLGGGSAAESIRKVMETYHTLKKVLKAAGLSTNVGSEGAFAPNGIADNEAPLKYIMEAIESAGYSPGEEIGLVIDPASSEFYRDGQYHLALENRSLSSDEMITYYQDWLERYPFVVYEDVLAEDDWDSWVKLTAAIGDKVEIMGDDLTVTSQDRIQKAIDLKAMTSVLIKLNQIGTLTETVDACMLAREHGMMTTPSHRGGGESNDAAMVDLAVAVGSRFIKVGPTRGERVSKYNRLLEIEQELRGS